MISGNTTAQDLLRHLNLTEPLEAGQVVGVQITKEKGSPMTVHIHREFPQFPHSCTSLVLDTYRWSYGDWLKVTGDQ